MQPPGMTEYDEHGTVQSGRTPRWSRVRPGRSFILFPTVVAGGWALLVGVFASISQLFGPQEDRGTWGDVIGAMLGNFVMVFVLAVVVSVIVRVARISETGTTPQPSHARMMRRVAIGGVVGGLPGLLIALVPLLLAGFGVISGDQSQIGFVGVPLLIIGILVGTLTAASDSGCTLRVLVGVVAGFVVAVLIGAGLGAVGAGTGAIFLFLMPPGMIVGAVLGTYLCGRHIEPDHSVSV